MHYRIAVIATCAALATACTTLTPETVIGPTDVREQAESVPQTPAPPAATSIKTYAPGSSISWTNIGDSDLSFSETVIYVGDDYVIYRDPEYTEEGEDTAEFYAIFSGVFYMDCPQAALVTQSDRRAFVEFWKAPKTSTARMVDAPNSTAYKYKVLTQSTMPTPTGDRAVYWLQETSDDEYEDQSIHFVTKDDLELVGWVFEQDDQYRLAGVEPPVEPLGLAIVERARAACDIAPLAPPVKTDD